MATLTEMVAAVVVHSSAFAFSHFGVTLDVPQADAARLPMSEQRVVARTHAIDPASRIQKASGCPDAPHARMMKA